MALFRLFPLSKDKVSSRDQRHEEVRQLEKSGFSATEVSTHAGEDCHSGAQLSDDHPASSISLDDDPTLPSLTFRTWFLGLGLACFGATLAQIFYFRPHTASVSQLFLLVIAYILGKVMEEMIPGPKNKRFPMSGTSAFWRFMNPGIFNIKEHVAITIFASTASESAIATQILAVDDLFFHTTPKIGTALCTIIGSQLLGYGLGGAMRSILVYPTHIVFPSLLPTVHTFEALHRDQNQIGRRQRASFFWLVFACIFMWEWIPQYIAPTLTGISVLCILNRDNAWITRVFGGSLANEGLGLLSISLDWNGISQDGPLFKPLSTLLCILAGGAVGAIISCVCFMKNIWNAQNFPFLSQNLYYMNGTVYQELRILNESFRLDYEKLSIEGLPYFATSQVIFKIGVTASFSAGITHVLLWHGPRIIEAIQRHRTRAILNDPHYIRMMVYPEVPLWWYLALFASSLAIIMVSVFTAGSTIPWWGVLLGICISSISMPLVITIDAVNGFSLKTENFVRMMGAVFFPGNAQANMYFSLYGSNTLEQAHGLVRDLKLGQYTKLPPRVTFIVQSVGAIVGGLINYVVMQSIINNHRALLLDTYGSNLWSGRQIQSLHSNAIAWGGLGGELYAPSGRYAIVPFSVFIGLVLPLPFWLLHQKWPRLGFNHVIVPALLGSFGHLSGISSAALVCFLIAVISQFYLWRYHLAWFKKYNFLLSAALDGGNQVMIFVLTFTVAGGVGKARPFPTWALNPTGNPDYCKKL